MNENEEAIRGKILRDLEEKIEPLIHQAGLMNALGTYQLALQVVRGK